MRGGDLMKNTIINEGLVTELCEVIIPNCESCKKEYELKLTTIDPDTQMGIGEYLPSCKCTL